MSTVMKRAMPDVKKFSSRNMNIPSSRNQLEFKLLDWIQEVLTYIGQNQRINGALPANFLVSNADGIDLLLKAAQYAPTTMALDEGGKTAGRNVYANFLWGVRADGHWYVKHVKFALVLSQTELSVMEQRALKDRLLDRAETENAKHFHAREYAFPAELYLHTWQDEMLPGNNLVRSIDETVYGWARKEASFPENPFKPWDIALGFIPGSKWAKKWGHGVERAEKMAEKYEEVEEVKKAYDRGETAMKLAEKGKGGEDKNGVYEETKGDIVAKQVVDEGADAAGDVVPGAGGLVKMFAGMLCDIGIANMAGEIARIRGRVYACFTGGFVSSLTLVGGTPPPPNKLDNEYFEKGISMAKTLNKRASFQLQLALLEYTRTHYTDPWWGGVTYEFRGVHPSKWHFPDDYVVKWSPELLGRSLIVQLWRHRLK